MEVVCYLHMYMYMDIIILLSLCEYSSFREFHHILALLVSRSEIKWIIRNCVELPEKIDWTVVLLIPKNWDKGRGAYECIFDKENKILAVWFDNTVVCIAMNYEPIDPIQSVRRFSTKEKQHVNIILWSHTTNKYMGGADVNEN
jgi:hypothetical protein